MNAPAHCCVIARVETTNVSLQWLFDVKSCGTPHLERGPVGPCESDPPRAMLANAGAWNPTSICAAAAALCARYVSASVFIFWHLEQVLETLNNKWHTDTLLETSTWAGARHSLKPDTLTLYALFGPFLSFPYHTITHVPTGNVRNGKCSMPHWPNNWTMVPAKLSSFMVPFILFAQHTE